MSKPWSAPIFNEQDFPISIVRLSILKGTGVDLDELKEKPIIGVANSLTDMNPGHMHLRIACRAGQGRDSRRGGNPLRVQRTCPL